MRYFIPVIFGLFYLQAKAQDNSFILHGKLLNARNNTIIRNAGIVNLRSKTSAVSDSNGNFLIPIEFLDSISIAAKGFRTQLFNLAMNPERHNGIMYIYVQGDTVFYHGASIKIKSYDEFKIDFLNKRVPDTLKIPGATQYNGERGNEQPTIFNPISLIRANFSTEATIKRRIKKQQKAMKDNAFKGVKAEDTLYVNDSIKK